MEKPIFVDFETEAIARRPQYPPKPVGVAIDGTYYAWGHPTENNCDKFDAQRVLAAAYRTGRPLAFQHGKFDIDVSEVHMGMPPLRWDLIHDTEYLLFLHDPHARSLSLKPAAEKILGWAPDERDAVRDWLEEHGIVRKKQKDWGAHISKAPGKLVGKYAVGDNARTKGLFQKLWPSIVDRGMLEGYNRERQLMPILLENERQGIRVNLKGLENDFNMYQQSLGFADNWLRKTLKEPDLNLDADAEVGEALDKIGAFSKWTLTPTGKKSVAKKNMRIDDFDNQRVALVLGYRNRIRTCLSMFMEPWLIMARESGGWIFTNWNQVRQDHGTEQVGARTGRLSSNPNFQNISKDFEAKNDGYKHPDFLKQLPPLPLMRKYLLPDSDKHTWGRRDYSQQELRALAHFEDGELLQNYLANPQLDVHAIVQASIKRLLKKEWPRDPVKTFVFQKLYGGGIPAVTAALNCDISTAKLVIQALEEALPGYKNLDDALKARAKSGLPIRTWGGREYYCEKAGFSQKHKRHMTFEYKMLNYLIQGSCADCTKEALIRYSQVSHEARFLVTVHDEINISMPKGREKQEMKILRDVMQSIEFDLPMLSDGKVGPNWGSLSKFEEQE